jgi:FkbM family methyltransferase
MSLKSAIQGLSYSRASFLLWPFLSAYSSVINRTITLVYQDRDGDWVKWELGSAVFFNSSLDGTSLRRATSNVQDYWFHAYEPSIGDVIVDAGAGIGDESLVMSRRVGPSGKIVAIEAHPRTFRCLQKTVRANRLDNVLALNVALSDSESVVQISDGDNHHSNQVGASAGIPVSALPLDMVLGRYQLRADLVKMNIEGAEKNALTGASMSLEITPHWVVSCHDFLAKAADDPRRTHIFVVSALRLAGLDVQQPRSHSLVEIPYFVYASRHSDG